MDPKLGTIARVFAILLVCVTGGLVSGCLYTFDGAPTRREPQPSLVEYRHDVDFAAGRFSLGREEGRRLEAFLARVGVGYGDRVYLAAVSPGGDMDETADRLAERRVESISSFLGLNDVHVDARIDGYGDASPVGDGVAVLVHRYVVGLPACPDWTEWPWEKQNNRPTSNWSCATATNFGMMVADPGDLVRGEEPGPGDGERLAGAVERYRKGETAPLMDDVSTQDLFNASSQNAVPTSSASGSGN